MSRILLLEDEPTIRELYFYWRCEKRKEKYSKFYLCKITFCVILSSQQIYKNLKHIYTYLGISF